MWLIVQSTTLVSPKVKSSTWDLENCFHESKTSLTWHKLPIERNHFSIRNLWHIWITNSFYEEIHMTKTQRSEIVITNPGSDKVKGLHAVKKEETDFHKSHGLNYKTVIVWDLYYKEQYIGLMYQNCQTKTISLSFRKGKGKGKVDNRWRRWLIKLMWKWKYQCNCRVTMQQTYTKQMSWKATITLEPVWEKHMTHWKPYQNSVFSICNAHIHSLLVCSWSSSKTIQ